MKDVERHIEWAIIAGICLAALMASLGCNNNGDQIARFSKRFKVLQESHGCAKTVPIDSWPCDDKGGDTLTVKAAIVVRIPDGYEVQPVDKSMASEHFAPLAASTEIAEVKR